MKPYARLPFCSLNWLSPNDELNGELKIENSCCEIKIGFRQMIDCKPNLNTSTHYHLLKSFAFAKTAA